MSKIPPKLAAVPTMIRESHQKFPWGTIILTGALSTVGSILAISMYEKFIKKKEREDKQAKPNAGRPDLYAMYPSGFDQNWGPGFGMAAAPGMEAQRLENLEHRLSELERFQYRRPNLAPINESRRSNPKLRAVGDDD